MAIFITILLIFIILIVGTSFLVINSNGFSATDIDNLKPYLCSVSKLRKKDGNINKGDCNIVFDDNTFTIKQDEETIENDIDSIYYFDIWEYKDDTYFKIRMRSLTEYIFKSVHFEADKIASYLKTKGIRIEDNRENY